MFADLKDMPTFGSHNASAWAYTEKDPFDCSRTSNPPAPNEADVKALLQMLSCRADDTELMNEPSTVYERLEVQSRPRSNSSEGADELAVGTHGSHNEDPSSFLRLLHNHDGNDGSMKLLSPESAAVAAAKECSYGANPSTTYRTNGSSSSNTLTGSSSASSHTDRPASTTNSRAAESASTRLSPAHPSRHNTAVSNALANIGSGLAEENFNVLTPDKRMMLSIPAEYIQTTLGSRNYRHRNRDKLLFSFCLCKTFCSGATCHHGADCDFIHCDPEKLRLVQSAAESKGKKADPTSVHSFQVHWSTPVNSLADAVYPCLPSGYVVYVKGGEGASGNAPQALPSEMVYATVGGQEALRLPSTAPLRVCKHYEREKCARGALCHFIHPVVLNKTAAALPPRSTPSAASSAFGSFSELGHPSSAAFAAQLPPPPPPMPLPSNASGAAGQASGAAHNAATLLTAAQLPSGALVRYGDALFMWLPERQQLVPLNTSTASGTTPAMAGQPPAMMVNVDYQRGPNGAMSSPAGFQMPANAMLVQSATAVAAYPPRNPYSNPPMQRNAPGMNPVNGASPVYPSMLFPC